MNSEEIRSRFLKFFEARGHKVVPSASLVPENDPSVLFNTAGMQALMPYFFGKKHPAGNRLVNFQKCLRTVDIEEIGDNTHATFFEMLGNWSLGSYFKKEAIEWSYEFLTSKDEGLGLDPQRLYVTCFWGDKNIPKDTEALEIWKSVGLLENRVYFNGVDANWWPAVKNDDDSWTGPTGTCSEMFYDITENGLGDLTPEEFKKADDEQKVVEIWNDVFMEYEKKDGKIIGKLPQKNIDTGAGFERLIAVVQKKGNIFDTDLFEPVIKAINESVNSDDEKAKRIIADHLRASIFLISDGVKPFNTDQGYILRRLLRRALYYFDSMGATVSISVLIEPIIEVYKNSSYIFDIKLINDVILGEQAKFKTAISFGRRQFEKFAENKDVISGNDAFILFSTFGFPLELTVEIAKENGKLVDADSFKEEFKKHQEVSRAGAEKKFKGGLAGHSEIEIKYHTATHLLHQALRDVLGNSVEQKGSNITPERLRFDFAHSQKITDEEKKKVEEIVNGKIADSLKVNKVVMSKEEAEKVGALHFFGDKYGDEVSVYYIGDSLETAYSKEFCGGPHVSNTSELASVTDPERKSKGSFKIIKEEAVSAGIRRIKAVLE